MQVDRPTPGTKYNNKYLSIFVNFDSSVAYGTDLTNVVGFSTDVLVQNSFAKYTYCRFVDFHFVLKEKQLHVACGCMMGPMDAYACMIAA